MAILVKLQDKSPALLFLRPDTRVVRLIGATYDEAFKALAGKVTLADKDGEKWANVVEKADGSTSVVLHVRR